MITIFHLMGLIVLTAIIYYRYFRFSKRNIINKLINRHYNEVKERLNKRSYPYEIEINLGFTKDKDNEEIIPKITRKLKSKGFIVKIRDVGNDTYLCVK